MKKITKAEMEVLAKAEALKNPFFKIGHLTQGWYHIGNGVVTDYTGYRTFCEELEQDSQHLLKQKN